MASRRKRPKRHDTSATSVGRSATDTTGGLPTPSRRLLRGWRLVAVLVVSLGLAAVAASRFQSDRHFRLGLEAFRLHRFDLADQQFAKALRWSPRGGEIAKMRSRAAWMNDDRQASQRHLADAVARGLDAASIEQERQLMKIRDGAGAEQHSRLPSMLQRSPEQGPAILEAFTAGSLARGDSVTASGILSIWERADPNDPRIHYWRGTLHQSFGEQIDAVEHFEAALRIAPQMTPARLSLAEVLEAQFLYAQAIDHYRQVVLEQPGSEYADVGLAICLVESGAVGDGVPRLEAAVQAYSENVSARLALAEHYQRESQWQTVLQTLEPMIDAQQNDITLNYLLANAYQHLRDPQRSTKYFDHFQRLKQILETTRLLAKEYESRPSPELARRIAAGYMECDWQEAGTWIMTAMSSDPSSVALNQMMANYLQRSGRTELADSYQSRAELLAQRPGPRSP
jgi:tetratricopeptide (TPR) repeat protein